MISIGMVIEKKSDYVYAINTIMNQSYEALEIICSLDEGMDISAYDVLECIRIHRKKNIKRVHIILDKRPKSFAEHLREMACVSRGDYVFFLSSKDALYDQEALNKIFEKGKLESSIVTGQTVLYKNNEFCGITHFDVIEGVQPFWGEVSDNIQNGMSILFKREFVESLCKNADMFYVYKEMSLKHVEVPCLRHELLEDEAVKCWGVGEACEEKTVLNYTNSIYIQNFIRRIVREKLNQKMILDEIELVEKFIIEKQAGGCWDVGDGDKCLLFFLRELGNICRQKRINRRSLFKLTREIKRYSRKKIKLLVLTQEYHLWNSLKSVYDEAMKDKRFLVDLVYLPFEHPQKSIVPEEELLYYKEAGYPIRTYDEYDLSKESPDVVIILKPYDSIPKEFLFSNIDKVIRRSVYIRYAPSVNFVMNERLIEMLYTLPAYFLMWKCLAYTRKEYEAAQKYSFQKGVEWLPIGHPRDDLSVKDLNVEERKYYDKLLYLAGGRKIFLWNTAAQIKKDADIVPYGSFLEWGENIIKYFCNRQDAFLVWRPHPLFFNALKEVWGEEKCRNFLEEIKKVENLYIDEYKQYMPAILSSDAFISDTSSLVDVYIPSMKPILLTKCKTQKLEQYDSDFLEAICVMNEDDDIADFADGVMNGKNRKNLIQKKYVSNNYFSLLYDEKVAKVLLDEIIKGINMEEKIMYGERKPKVGDIEWD